MKRFDQCEVEPAQAVIELHLGGDAEGGGHDRNTGDVSVGVIIRRGIIGPIVALLVKPQNDPEVQMAVVGAKKEGVRSFGVDVEEAQSVTGLDGGRYRGIDGPGCPNVSGVSTEGSIRGCRNNLMG